MSICNCDHVCIWKQMDGVHTNTVSAQRWNFPEIFSSAVWIAIWPTVLGISMLYIILTQELSEKGQEEGKTPIKCKNGRWIKTWPRIQLLHSMLSYSSSVWRASCNKGFYPLLAGVTAYHPSCKHHNCLHVEITVVKHLIYLLLSLKSI